MSQDVPDASPSMVSRLAAEFFGTFLLVLGGVGTAVFAASFPDDGNALGVGFLGVSLAFGFTVLCGVYAVGHISGGHFNPAVTLGAAFAGRLPWKDVIGYWVVSSSAASPAHRSCSRSPREARTASSTTP